MVIDESTAKAFIRKQIGIRDRRLSNLKRNPSLSRKGWLKGVAKDFRHLSWIIHEENPSKNELNFILLSPSDNLSIFQYEGVFLNNKKFTAEVLVKNISLSIHAICRIMQINKSTTFKDLNSDTMLILSAVKTLTDGIDNLLEGTWEVYIGGYGVVPVIARFDYEEDRMQYIIKTVIGKDVLNPGKANRLSEIEDTEIMYREL